MRAEARFVTALPAVAIIERIDPIVALIMAVGRTMAEESGLYADCRGLLIVGG